MIDALIIATTACVSGDTVAYWSPEGLAPSGVATGVYSVAKAPSGERVLRTRDGGVVVVPAGWLLEVRPGRCGDTQGKGGGSGDKK